MVDGEGRGRPAISHRLPVVTPDGRAPMIFTVDRAPDQRGTFLVTCREVLDVVMFAEDEEELVRVAQATREVLEAHRTSPDFPYWTQARQLNEAS